MARRWTGSSGSFINRDRRDSSRSDRRELPEAEDAREFCPCGCGNPPAPGDIYATTECYLRLSR